MYLFMLFLKIFLMYLYILAQVHKAFLCCSFIYFFFRTKRRFDFACIHLLFFFWAFHLQWTSFILRFVA